jgi:hypothetical protein
VADCLTKVSAGEVAHVWQIKSGDEFMLMLRQPLRNRLAAARDEEEQVAAAAELAFFVTSPSLRRPPGFPGKSERGSPSVLERRFGEAGRGDILFCLHM